MPMFDLPPLQLPTEPVRCTTPECFNLAKWAIYAPGEDLPHAFLCDEHKDMMLQIADSQFPAGLRQVMEAIMKPL